MRLEYYHKAGTTGCCPLTFYAVLFDRSHQSLKDNGLGVRVLSSFTGGSSQTNYAIVLNEHPQRSRFYYLDLDPSAFVLAANTRGQKFTVEIWKAFSSGTYNRTNDELVEVREVMWDGSEFIDAELGEVQLEELSHYEPQLAASYDSNENALRAMAFLEKNGQLLDDSTLCEFQLINRAGVEMTASSITNMLTAQPGIFSWDEPGIVLDPDEVYAVVVTITRDGVQYKGASVEITWD